MENVHQAGDEYVIEQGSGFPVGRNHRNAYLQIGVAVQDVLRLNTRQFARK
jgi:hypothetical protein